LAAPPTVTLSVPCVTTFFAGGWPRPLLRTYASWCFLRRFGPSRLLRHFGPQGHGIHGVSDRNEGGGETPRGEARPRSARRWSSGWISWGRSAGTSSAAVPASSRPSTTWTPRRIRGGGTGPDPTPVGVRATARFPEGHNPGSRLSFPRLVGEIGCVFESLGLVPRPDTVMYISTRGGGEGGGDPGCGGVRPTALSRDTSAQHQQLVADLRQEGAAARARGEAAATHLTAQARELEQAEEERRALRHGRPLSGGGGRGVPGLNAFRRGGCRD